MHVHIRWHTLVLIPSGTCGPRTVHTVRVLNHCTVSHRGLPSAPSAAIGPNSVVAVRGPSGGCLGAV